MILLAKEEQKAEIRELWETCFPKEDPAYIDHYFKNIWTPRSCYVDMEDGYAEILMIFCLMKKCSESVC